MNRNRAVVATAVFALLAFAVAAFFYTRDTAEPEAAVAEATVEGQPGLLERFHSPTIGPAAAPVTIVEFFDPSCETCRAFHPIVKQILDAYPDDVRLVIRYATFHEGSDEAVRILEAARAQGLYDPVMEALLARQPDWAIHGAPNISLAWGIAVNAGLNLTEAQAYAASATVDAVLAQDAADVVAANVTATPTFFVNGQPLPSFGAQQLADLVQSEVLRARQN